MQSSVLRVFVVKLGSCEQRSVQVYVRREKDAGAHLGEDVEELVGESLKSDLKRAATLSLAIAVGVTLVFRFRHVIPDMVSLVASLIGAPGLGFAMVLSGNIHVMPGWPFLFAGTLLNAVLYTAFLLGSLRGLRLARSRK